MRQKKVYGYIVTIDINNFVIAIHDKCGKRHEVYRRVWKAVRDNPWPPKYKLPVGGLRLGTLQYGLKHDILIIV